MPSIPENYASQPGETAIVKSVISGETFDQSNVHIAGVTFPSVDTLHCPRNGETVAECKARLGREVNRVQTAEEITSRDTLLLSIYPNLRDSGWWFLIGKSGVCHSAHGFATAADAAKAATECLESFSANPAKFVTERAGE